MYETGVPAVSERIGVELVGSQFVSAIHAESLQRCPDAELVGAASLVFHAEPTP